MNYMTADEKKSLEDQLKQLNALRKDLSDRIGRARELGDLKENAEYHAALERQAFVRARIGQLRERIGALNALNLSQIPTDRAAMGSTLELLDYGLGSPPTNGG